MNARLGSLLLCVLLAGCSWFRNVNFIDPADPALTKKLGITEQDWVDLRQLATEMTGYVLNAVGKAEPDVIEIEFKKPADRLGDQGGPIARYEKKAGVWKRQEDFNGVWEVTKVP